MIYTEVDKARFWQCWWHAFLVNGRRPKYNIASHYQRAHARMLRAMAERRCASCGGHGEIAEDVYCHKCNGTGRKAS